MISLYKKIRILRYNLILLVSVFTVSCNTITPISENNSNEFEFEKLTIKNHNKDGQIKYIIRSERATVENSQNKIIAFLPVIILYNNNQPQYTINSRDGIINNIEQIINLNGNVQMFDSLNELINISADSMKWDIGQSKISFISNVKLNHKESKVVANRADYYRNKDEILFYEISTINNQIFNKGQRAVIGVDSEEAVYNLITKKLEFSSQNNRVRSTINLN